MKIFLLVIIILISNTGFSSQQHYNKKINIVQAANNTHCIYFTLEGVPEADPIAPNQPWFAVASDSPVKSELLSLAMLAYASEVNVIVSTTGNDACGFAEVHYLRLIK